MTSLRSLPLAVAAALVTFPAHAQDRASHDEAVEPAPPPSRSGVPARDDDARPETATPDPTPEAPSPRVPGEAELEAIRERGVIEQAGVGGPISYGDLGVLEVGGSGYLSGNELAFWAAIRPFVGLFVADGFQLGIGQEILTRYVNESLSVSYLGTLDANVYLPVVSKLWVQLGVGVGGLYNGDEGAFVGLGRAGFAMLVGRASVLHVLVTGGGATAPFARPEEPIPSASRWRLGAEIGYGALF